MWTYEIYLLMLIKWHTQSWLTRKQYYKYSARHSLWYISSATEGIKFLYFPYPSLATRCLAANTLFSAQIFGTIAKTGIPWWGNEPSIKQKFQDQGYPDLIKVGIPCWGYLVLIKSGIPWLGKPRLHQSRNSLNRETQSSSKMEFPD